MPSRSPRTVPHILLVNPWIHDFAAYDVWAKPMGLLMLGSILRRHGLRISYMDCLDRFHPRASEKDPYARNGRGPYGKTRLKNPQGLEDIPRRFSRYGIQPEWFDADLKTLHSSDRPDLILVTSLMTYWYPGTIETIGMIKTVFPDTPVILGGIYPTLFADHARKHCGADKTLSGPGAPEILNIVSDFTGIEIDPEFDPQNLNTYPCPALDLQRRVSYIPLLTSVGCPFSCSYCASSVLNPLPMRRDPAAVVTEIQMWHEKFGVNDFVFYDDALLVNARRHIRPLLEGVIAAGLKIRFHTPNALHVREIDESMTRLMKASGFHTIRLGLETTDVSVRKNGLDEKVTLCEFHEAVACLKTAGFSKNQVGAYLLAGLPDESEAAVYASIDLVKAAGVTPIMAHYTPLPFTGLWEKAKAASRYDLEADPIFTNNAIYPCSKEPFSWKRFSRFKNRVQE